MNIEVNYLAVLCSAVASMVVGFVWYGVLFRKKWMDLMGITPDSMRNMKMSANTAYVIQFVASFLMAYVLSHLISIASAYQEMGGLSVGFSTAFWSWLGLIVPTSIGIVLWENKPWKLWCINASHYLVSLLVMGAILSLW